jgi:hypothetical protein
MVRHAAAAVALVIILSPSWLSAQSTTFTVTTESATVHKGPSTGAAVIGQVSRGRMLPVMRELGSWVKVAWPEAEDGAGYVHVSWGTLGQKTAVTERQTTAAPEAARAGAHPARAGAATPSTRPAAQAGQTPGTPASAEQLRGGEPLPPARRAPVSVAPASHLLGLGGRLGNSPAGFGIAARVWRAKGFGVQVDASRYATTSAVTAARLTSMEIEPSVMFALPDRVGDYLWLRPYAGSGVMLRHQALGGMAPGATSTTSNGWGWQAFGGGEFTFAGAPQLAVSADVGYRRLKTPVDGFDLGGVGLSVSAHWYVK